MILKYLTLYNFGVFAGSNTLDLSAATNKKPVTLIGGLNGRGKTTLLEAILLVLYGKLSYAVESSRLSYSDYLSKYMNTTRHAHEAYIELIVQMEPNQPELTIKRSWSKFDMPIEDRFTVFCGDVPDPYLADNWYAYIETLLPAGVSNLFFFDGEKITELANDVTDEGLKNSIRALLGIDTINRLISDLNRIIDRQNNTAISEAAYMALEIKKEEIKENARQLSAAYADRAEISKEEDNINEQIKSVRKSLLTRSNHSNADSLEQTDQDEKAKLDEIDQLLKDLLGGCLPFAMVMPLLSDAIGDVQKDIEYYMNQVGTDQIISFQDKLMQFLKSENIDSKSYDMVHSFIEQNRPAKKDVLYGQFFATEEELHTMRAIYQEDVKYMAQKTTALISERDKIRNANDGTMIYLQHALSNKDDGKLIERFEKLTKDLTRIEDRKKNLTNIITTLEKAERELTQCVREHQQKILESEHSKLREARIAKYAGYSVQIMNKYKIALQAQKVRKLADAINQCFDKLIGKEKLVHNIEVDESTLDISLADTEGKKFSKTKLSAGERQMLAIATLWGLSSCMDTRLPVFIDTPLARLDSTHRERFIKDYLPHAGEQVIVLSTDEEIYGRYYEMLSNHVASSYLLKFDSDTSETQIVNGYFAEK